MNSHERICTWMLEYAASKKMRGVMAELQDELGAKNAALGDVEARLTMETIDMVLQTEKNEGDATFHYAVDLFWQICRDDAMDEQLVSRFAELYVGLQAISILQYMSGPNADLGEAANLLELFFGENEGKGHPLLVAQDRKKIYKEFKTALGKLNPKRPGDTLDELTRKYDHREVRNGVALYLLPRKMQMPKPALELIEKDVHEGRYVCSVGVVDPDAAKEKEESGDDDEEGDDDDDQAPGKPTAEQVEAAKAHARQLLQTAKVSQERIDADALREAFPESDEAWADIHSLKDPKVLSFLSGKRRKRRREPEPNATGMATIDVDQLQKTEMSAADFLVAKLQTIKEGNALQEMADEQQKKKKKTNPSGAKQLLHDIVSQNKQLADSDGVELLEPLKPLQPSNKVVAKASSSSSAAAPPSAKKAKKSAKKNPWTLEETNALLEGVSKCGLGKWAKIRSDYGLLEHRSGAQLKDKWRNLMNGQDAQMRQKAVAAAAKGPK